MNVPSNNEVALSLIKDGFHIVPCDPVSKKPCGELVPNGFYDASNDEVQVREWWNWKRQHLIVGIWPSKSNIVVIDCDNKDGKQGVEAFHKLCTERGIDLSSAFIVSTPNNVLHYYFRSNVKFGNSEDKLPDGVQIRNDKGYVISAGSTLSDGRSYRLVQGSVDTIPQLPDALAALLRPVNESATPGLPIVAATPQKVTERQRSYALEAMNGMLDEMRPLTKPGSDRDALYNERLYKMGAYVREGWIDFQVVAGAFYAVMRETGYLDLPEHRDAVDKINRSVKQGIETADLPQNAPLPEVEVPQWLRDSIAQWIEAYKAELKAQAGSLFDFLENIKPLQEYDIPPITYLVNRMIPEASIIMLSGGPGSGKSTLAMKIAYLASVPNQK